MLVARIAAGDRLAMQTLFARHRTAIYRWLLRFVGNETVAEDMGFSKPQTHALQQVAHDELAATNQLGQ